MLKILELDAAVDTLLKRVPLDEIEVTESMRRRTIAAFGEDLTPEQSVRRILRDVRARGDVALRLDDALSAERVRGALDLKAVGGSASLLGIEAAAAVEAIGGSLQARELGSTLRCRAVGGNVELAAVQGAVHVNNVGGNLTIEGAIADLHVGNVGGSLRAAEAVLTGSFTLNVGGAAALRLAARADGQIRLRAGGGVDCTVTPDSDATFTVLDGGGRRELRVGAGAGRVTVQCGGRANVHGPDGALMSTAPGGEAPRRGWLDRFMRPAPPEPPTPPFAPMPPEPPEPGQRKSSVSSAAVSASAAAPGAGPSAEERMTVLRLLADKKITVEQAEQLLAALG